MYKDCIGKSRGYVRLYRDSSGLYTDDTGLDMGLYGNGIAEGYMGFSRVDIGIIQGSVRILPTGWNQRKKKTND